MLRNPDGPDRFVIEGALSRYAGRNTGLRLLVYWTRLFKQGLAEDPAFGMGGHARCILGSTRAAHQGANRMQAGGQAGWLTGHMLTHWQIIIDKTTVRPPATDNKSSSGARRPHLCIQRP